MDWRRAAVPPPTENNPLAGVAARRFFGSAQQSRHLNDVDCGHRLREDMPGDLSINPRPPLAAARCMGKNGQSVAGVHDGNQFDARRFPIREVNGMRIAWSASQHAGSYNCADGG